MISVVAAALLHFGANGIAATEAHVPTCRSGRMYYAIGSGKLDDVIEAVQRAIGIDVMLWDKRILDNYNDIVQGVGGYYTAEEALEAAIGSANVSAVHLGGCTFTYIRNSPLQSPPIPLPILTNIPLPRTHGRSIPRQRACDCWLIDGKGTGTLWCTRRDDGTIGMNDDCRKLGGGAK